ncbi:hypothetical protein ACFX1Z_025010 [Malus domestica]
MFLENGGGWLRGSVLMHSTLTLKSTGQTGCDAMTLTGVNGGAVLLMLCSPFFRAVGKGDPESRLLERRISWHQRRRGWRGVQEEAQAFQGSVSYLCNIQPNPSPPIELHLRDAGRWCQLCRRVI